MWPGTKSGKTLTGSKNEGGVLVPEGVGKDLETWMMMMMMMRGLWIVIMFGPDMVPLLRFLVGLSPPPRPWIMGLVSVPTDLRVARSNLKGALIRYACGKKRLKRGPDQSHDLTSELPDHIGLGYRTFAGDPAYKRSLLKCWTCGQVGGALYKQFVKNHTACALGNDERLLARGNLANEEKCTTEAHIGKDSRSHKRRRAQAAAVMMVDTWT